MGIDKGGIQTQAILKMSNSSLQLTCARSADTMLEVLADELLTLG